MRRTKRRYVILSDDTRVRLLTAAKLSLFRAVVGSRAADLLSHARRCFDSADSRSTILAFDAWVHSGILESLERESVDQVADMLRACRQYCTVVNTVVQRRELFDKPKMQRLFGISSSSSDTTRKEEQDVTVYRQVVPWSFVHSKALRFAGSQPKTVDMSTAVMVSKDAVDDMICHSLLLRLNTSLLDVHQHALKSGAFELCTRFLTTGQCPSFKEGRCWRGHPQPNELTIQSFNSRIRIHLLIMSLLDQFAALNGAFDAERSRAAMQR